MIIIHNREKLLNAILYFLRHTKYCGKTKLFKLLYFADFLHFKETGKSITGLDYYAWQHGPYPKSLADEFKTPQDDLKRTIAIIPSEPDSNNSFTDIRPKGKFDKNYFTKREFRILERVAEIFKEVQAEQIREASHLKNHPWDVTIKIKGEHEKIDYMLALDNTPGSLNVEEVKERIAEKEEILKIFNG